MVATKISLLPLHSLFALLDEPDLCATGFLVLLLAFIGGVMVGRQQGPYQWGLRLGAVSFIAYASYAAFTFRPADASGWTDALLKSLLAAGLTLGPSWIVLACCAFAYRYGIDLPRAWFRNRAAAFEQRHDAHSRAEYQQEEERRRTQQDAERRIREREQAERKAEAQRRRTDARAAAALSFSIYSPKLGDRFTKEMLDEYMERFMGDDERSEDVERRYRELVAILEKHVQEIDEPKKRTSLVALAEWFLEQKHQIDASALSLEDKGVLIAQLEERYAKLQQQHIRGIQP